MSNYLPGAPLQLETYAWSTSKVGTLTVELVALSNRNVTIPAQTAGIAFDSSTKAHWINTLSAPTVQGEYDAIWDDHAGTTATERITVTISSPAASAVMAGAFITIDDLSAVRQRTTAPDDALAIMAISAACNTLRAESAQSLDYAESTDVMVTADGFTDTILLPETPVHEVTAVKLAGLPIDSSSWFLDKEDGSIKAKWYNWIRGRYVYTVDYKHGYLIAADVSKPNVPTFPPALRLLAATVAARIYDQGIVAQESVGGYSATFSSSEAHTLTIRERGLLENLVGVGKRRR